MKAIVYHEYGAPDVLKLADIPKPLPGDNEILVNIHATTVTSGDSRLRAMRVPLGFRTITRLVFGISKPRNEVLGRDFSGIVEAVGKDVKAFKVGDEVFGARENQRCYAEYVTMPEDGPVVLKPANISFEEAAAVPFGTISSLIYLRNFGKIKAGEKILIYGASGALGTAAVQLAKHFGAEVTGVCSTANLEMVKSLGADKVIDYTQTDFSEGDETYDVIYDTVGKVDVARCKKVLATNGRCLLAVASIPQYLQMLWTKIVGGKQIIAGVAMANKKDMHYLKELLAAGKLKAVIDRQYPLTETVAAHQYVDKGHKKGNVVLAV